MADVREVRLPGVGVRYEFRTTDGRQLAVIHHRTGERELAVYDERDPDAGREILRLEEEDSRTLVELLGASHVEQEIGRLRQAIEGLAIDWLPLSETSPFVGRTIGDTRARTLTGVSVVAVVRGEDAFPAPGPEFRFEAGDTLVVVGTARGIESVAVLLRAG